MRVLRVTVKPISRECRAAGEALTTVLRESVRYADPLGLISESRLIPHKIAALIWRHPISGISFDDFSRNGIL